jgi:hypothetical protein
MKDSPAAVLPARRCDRRFQDLNMSLCSAPCHQGLPEIEMRKI